MLTNRFATWRAIFAHPWAYCLGAVYGVVGFLDFFRAHILPVEYHDIWDSYPVIPALSLKTWAIIGLVVIVLILLEGSYNLVKQQGEDHQAVIESLRSDLTQAQQNRDAKRTLLLQKILSAKSDIYASRWELIGVLYRDRAKITPQRMPDGANMVEWLGEYHDALETLHTKRSSYSDETTLNELEQAISEVDVISSNAKDKAKLVETFIKDSLHTN